MKVVLAGGSGSFDRLTGLAGWGLGGRIGNGRQWVSWLHVDDFLGIVRLALEDPGVSGVVHATSPTPVTNAELMSTLRRVVHRPAAHPPVRRPFSGAWPARHGSGAPGAKPTTTDNPESHAISRQEQPATIR